MGNSTLFTGSLLCRGNYIVAKDEIFVIGDNRLPGESNDNGSFRRVSVE
ncbi:MAG: hypothetical protein ACTHW2_06245 [Tissierella sp.]